MSHIPSSASPPDQDFPVGGRLKHFVSEWEKAFLSLFGLLYHACDMIPLGRLHLRPLQFYLKCFWKAHKDIPFVVIETRCSILPGSNLVIRYS